MLVLKKEVLKYTDAKTQKEREYTNIYVDIAGVKVQVKAADRTGQELIQNALDSNK